MVVWSPSFCFFPHVRHAAPERDANRLRGGTGDPRASAATTTSRRPGPGSHTCKAARPSAMTTGPSTQGTVEGCPATGRHADATPPRTTSPHGSDCRSSDSATSHDRGAVDGHDRYHHRGGGMCAVVLCVNDLYRFRRVPEPIAAIRALFRSSMFHTPFTAWQRPT